LENILRKHLILFYCEETGEREREKEKDTIYLFTTHREISLFVYIRFFILSLIYKEKTVAAQNFILNKIRDEDNFQ